MHASRRVTDGMSEQDLHYWMFEAEQLVVEARGAEERFNRLAPSQKAFLSSDKIPTTPWEHLDPAVVKQGELNGFRDVEKDWEFWQTIVAPNGTVDVEQVKLELSDFSMLAEGIAELYMHVTGGKCSKWNTHKSVVIQLHDEYVNERCEEAEKDALDGVEIEIAVPDIKGITERFLSWHVPVTCTPDGTNGDPRRTGTNLLSYSEAKAMFEYVLQVPENRVSIIQDEPYKGKHYCNGHDVTPLHRE